MFIKESIDAGVKQAKKDAKVRRAKEKAEKAEKAGPTGVSESRSSNDAPNESGQSDHAASESLQGETEKGAETGDNRDAPDEDDEDEEVVVRGFSGNATKTEKGIKYLGKRLAKYVLSMASPDHPPMPASKSASESIAQSLKLSSNKPDKDAISEEKVHQDSVLREGKKGYKITKISFKAVCAGPVGKIRSKGFDSGCGSP